MASVWGVAKATFGIHFLIASSVLKSSICLRFLEINHYNRITKMYMWWNSVFCIFLFSNYFFLILNLTFRGPYIISIFLLIYLQQDATLHSLFISGKLLYMFRVVFPPIIRSTIQFPHHTQTSSTVLAGSSNGLTSTRYCKYSCVCSWWWVEIPPETSRAVFQK